MRMPVVLAHLLKLAMTTGIERHRVFIRRFADGLRPAFGGGRRRQAGKANAKRKNRRQDGRLHSHFLRWVVALPARNDSADATTRKTTRIACLEFAHDTKKIWKK
jgi:hypothetical protein